MPEQKPGRSKQNYGTPPQLITAVEALLEEKFTFDLAAEKGNHKTEKYFSEQDDSLSQNWSEIPGPLWLNPPFANISVWAEKCWQESWRGAKIVMLVPASVGSNWYAKFVHNKAHVLAIRPRLTFEGCEDPYPKDCILIFYGFGKTGFDLWKWQ